MTDRKIRAMHRRFGTHGDDRCKTCVHCKKYDYHGKTYYKCELYGISHSDATDWRVSYQACGMYNDEVYDRWEPVYSQIKRDAEPLDGQIEMEVADD